MFLKKILHYINPLTFFGRKKEGNINLRMMHGINRISFLMFIVCLIIMIYRYFSA